MSNYEGKLGEWLKYVQQQVDAAKTPEEEAKAEQESKAESTTGSPVDIPNEVTVRDRLGRTLASDAREVDTNSIIGDFSLIEDRGRSLDQGPPLFDDDDIPQVEDYLPFLRERDDRMPEPPPMPEIASPDQRLLNIPEGTGEPKPVIRKPVETPPPPVVKAEATPAVSPVRPEPAPVIDETPKVKPVRVRARKDASIDAATIGQLWNQVPRHIQVLVGQVPKDSYKEFQETREELITRLLDPIISLDEAARILSVCPTTVRRYTNRGVLQHLRTVGNQRRFRLSDVLAFLESSSGTPATS